MRDGYHARYEVQDMVDDLQKIDLHKAFLFNSPDVDSMLEKFQRILAYDLSETTYRMEQVLNAGSIESIANCLEMSSSSRANVYGYLVSER